MERAEIIAPSGLTTRMSDVLQPCGRLCEISNLVNATLQRCGFATHAKRWGNPRPQTMENDILLDKPFDMDSLSCPNFVHLRGSQDGNCELC